MTKNIGSDGMKFSISKLHKITTTISNVSELPLGKEVIGPDFSLTPECICSISFRKDVCPDVYICNKSDGEIKIQRNIILKDVKYKQLYEENDTEVYSLRKNEKVDLIGDLDSAFSYDTLTKDTLIIDLFVSIIEPPTTKIINTFIIDTDHGRKLLEDFKNMLENPVNSDVSLQVGEERVPAHWSVLCSRSPYFKRMFGSEMVERLQNTVTITDVSISNLKKLIKFLYTAEFAEGDSDDLEELFDLYYAADKYEVMDLRTLCGWKIMSKSTSDNICQIFQLAHLHNDKGLKMQAMDFIQGQSEAVFKTEGWKKLKASEPLAADVFNFFLKKK